jgi:imidazolonepropionase-like amidohydrolase
VFAIDVGRLFDGERVTRDGAVVMVDEARVLGVLPRGTPVPAGCPVTRFPDAALLAGLIETHVHLCCDSGPGALDRLAGFGDAELATITERALGAHLASGVTTVRDLGDRRGAVLAAIAALRHVHAVYLRGRRM